MKKGKEFKMKWVMMEVHRMRNEDLHILLFDKDGILILQKTVREIEIKDPNK